MLKPGSRIIVNAVKCVTKPRWCQELDESVIADGTFVIFEVMDGSTEMYAWYRTDKGTLVVTDHEKIAELS